MAAKKPKTEPKAKPKAPAKPNRSGRPLHVYIPPALFEAIDRASARGRRSMTAEVIIALEKHAIELGLYEAPPEE